MAKQRYGINDAYRGSVGTVIGYEWRGKWCLRAKPRFMHNPRTERQQRNRELFKATVLLAGAMKQALHVGFRARSLEEHLTECNRFLRVNKGCFALADGVLEVDYEHLALSEGALAGVEYGEPVGQDNVLTLPFHRIAEEPCGEGDDRVYLYAWCPERSEGRISVPTYRSSRRATIELAEAWTGCEVQLFGFVANLKGEASATVYIGELAPSLGEDHEGHGGEDEGYAAHEAQGEGFAEDEDAYEDSRQGLEGAEDGRGRGAEVFGGVDHHDEGHDGRYDGEPSHPEPRRGRGRQGEALAADEGVDHIAQGAEEEDVEVNLEGRHGEGRLVDDDDIEGVGEGGEEHEHDAEEAEGGVVVALREECHAHEGEEEGEGRQPGDFLTEEEGHDGGGHDGVGEEDGGGHAGGHVVEGEVEGEGGAYEEEAEGCEGGELAAGDAKAFAAEEHDDGHDDPGEAEAIEKNRGGVHPLGIQVERSQRVGAVAYGGAHGADYSD